MADPRITRDILRGALNKHGDNDDMTSFERVLNAMDGLEDEIAHYAPRRLAVRREVTSAASAPLEAAG
jgi:hypothetical protein